MSKLPSLKCLSMTRNDWLLIKSQSSTKSFNIIASQTRNLITVNIKFMQLLNLIENLINIIIIITILSHNNIINNILFYEAIKFKLAAALKHISLSKFAQERTRLHKSYIKHQLCCLILQWKINYYFIINIYVLCLNLCLVTSTLNNNNNINTNNNNHHHRRNLLYATHTHKIDLKTWFTSSPSNISDAEKCFTLKTATASTTFERDMRKYLT